jgi:hypothetical protein
MVVVELPLALLDLPLLTRVAAVVVAEAQPLELGVLEAEVLEGLHQ